VWVELGECDGSADDGASRFAARRGRAVGIQGTRPEGAAQGTGGVGQGLGLLENWRDEQAEHEKDFVGTIAWFFTLAPRVREAAGLPRHSARGALVTGTVATFQGVLIAALGGALAIPLAHVFGWL